MECSGDFNPFRVEPACRSCGDLGVVSTTRFIRRDDELAKSDVKPCPACKGGTSGYRKIPLPTLTMKELSDSERAQVREWRAQGHHELDCLRWIEGQRYDPEKDPEFLEECRKALAKWRLLSGRV